ncbi:hypothetical protein E2C01_037911 [Portunus trituberculatus]|uniref:Uncharacterized protein n=1 Tax=Portunus trituberculatus TaxID=210409 RepID=A0A5B7FCR6_PORTR|nr:hypothetical protein [Portunus trituberculatus]
MSVALACLTCVSDRHHTGAVPSFCTCTLYDAPTHHNSSPDWITALSCRSHASPTSPASPGIKGQAKQPNLFTGVGRQSATVLANAGQESFTSLTALLLFLGSQHGYPGEDGGEAMEGSGGGDGEALQMHHPHRTTGIPHHHILANMRRNAAVSVDMQAKLNTRKASKVQDQAVGVKK